METIGSLLIIGVLGFVAIYMLQNQAKGSNWIGFLVAVAVGLMLAGTELPNWIQALGQFFMYAGAAGLLLLLGKGIWDIYKDRKPDMWAFFMAFLSPTLAVVSVALIGQVFSQSMDGGLANLQSAW